ncbi:hypothetical protein AURDEDRAFT_112949 [Auricularia subglabra TFB-10046 SS5]|nr:hypothetical protein AURDEDRAFT_112949 [Auricularia subglabra TFB-10046 SS5]
MLVAQDDDSDPDYDGGNAMQSLPPEYYQDDDKVPAEVVLGLKRRVDDDDSEIDRRTRKRARVHSPEWHPRDVNALIDMFRNDRKLWFGSGFRSKAEAIAVIEGY